MQRRTFISATAATAATVAAPMLKAQTLPNGPVRIVVGFPPGGGTDALARVVGQKLTAMWNTSVLIENKGGAAGVIAADYVSKQAGDGNTLLMAHINSHALAPALGIKLGYNAERDFVPISMVGVTLGVIMATIISDHITNSTSASRAVKRWWSGIIIMAQLMLPVS